MTDQTQTDAAGEVAGALVAPAISGPDALDPDRNRQFFYRKLNALIP